MTHAPAKHAAHGHAHGAHPHPPYMKVFYGLIVLTAAEVAIVFLPIDRTLINLSLVSMSLAKAALVGAYFMHLALDSKKLMIVVGSPFVLSAMLFVIPVLETLSSQ